MTLFGHTIEFNPKRTAPNGGVPRSAGGRSLHDAPTETVVTVRGFKPGLSPERRAHLQAYGLIPGRCAKIIQHLPVLVVQVDHCELALEADLACLIEIE